MPVASEVTADSQCSGAASKAKTIDRLIHQQDQQRFSIERDGHLAHLDYRLNGNRVDFTQTYTPPSLRGQGIAAELVAAGVEWATEQGLNIDASCSYVAAWLQRKPNHN